MDDERDDDQLMEYPAWREAINRLVKAKRLTPGTLFTHRELYEMFMVKYPEREIPIKPTELAKLELQYLAQLKGFETTLLEEHQVALANVKGEGYRIVPPQEQTPWAERQGINEVRKAIRKLANRLTNVDFVQLGTEARKANADALARLGMMGGMIKQVTEFKLSPLKANDSS
jgi:hypothetical protein